DRLIAETIHDGETDGKGIGAGLLVEIDVLDIELADAPVVAPFPPDETTVVKMRFVRQRRDDMPLDVRDKEHPCGASDHLRDELVRLASGAGVVFPQEAGQWIVRDGSHGGRVFGLPFSMTFIPVR